MRPNVHAPKCRAQMSCAQKSGHDSDGGYSDRDRDRDTIMLLSWSMSRAKFKIFEFRSGQRPGHAPISSIFHFKIINLSWQYSMNIFLPIDINFIWFCKFWLYEMTVWKNMLFLLKFDRKPYFFLFSFALNIQGYL